MASLREWLMVWSYKGLSFQIMYICRIRLNNIILTITASLMTDEMFGHWIFLKLQAYFILPVTDGPDVLDDGPWGRKIIATALRASLAKTNSSPDFKFLTWIIISRWRHIMLRDPLSWQTYLTNKRGKCTHFRRLRSTSQKSVIVSMHRL